MSEEIYYDETEYKAPEENPNEYKKGLAIASFVLSLVNLFCCFCYGTPILATLAIIFAIVSLATHRGGQVFSIIGLVLSGIAMVTFIGMCAAYGPIMKDAFKLGSNPQYYIEEYDRTGEVPEEFQKYCDPKYDQYFAASGYNDFETFYASLIDSMRDGMNSAEQYSDTDDEDDVSSDSSSSESRNDDDSGEAHVDLSYTGASTDIKLRAI